MIIEPGRPSGECADDDRDHMKPTLQSAGPMFSSTVLWLGWGQLALYNIAAHLGRCGVGHCCSANAIWGTHRVEMLVNNLPSTRICRADLLQG